MKLNAMLFATAILTGSAASAAPLTTGLLDYYFNLNGTATNLNTTYYQPPTALAAIPGLNALDFNSGTGLGTITFTYKPGAAGNYNFDAYIQDSPGAPLQQQYGIVNGSPAAGQTYEIDNVDQSNTSSDIGTNTANDTLTKTNHIPSTAGVSTQVGMAQGFDFHLAANQYAVITLSVAETNAGGFSLEVVQPAIPGFNATATDYFFSGSEQTFTNIVGNTPEPGFLGVFAGVLCCLALIRRPLQRAVRNAGALEGGDQK